jgi:hypothetical protein
MCKAPLYKSDNIQLHVSDFYIGSLLTWILFQGDSNM